MSTSSELKIQLPKNVALHARPAGSFVKVAMSYLSTIRVIAGDREANAKSILEVMALGAEVGSEISVRQVAGRGKPGLAQALVHLVVEEV